MHIREIVKHTKADFAAGNSVLWKGPPGWAKTAVSLELYAQLVADAPNEKIGLCRVFMATQQDVDATGLPWKSEIECNGKKFTITDPAMPRWYITSEGKPACEYDRVLLVMEEWGQGSAETKRAFASVMLEKGVPGFYLPAGSYVLALTNVDASDGITKEFDFVIGRRSEYTVTPDVTVFLEDFASKPYQYGGKEWTVSPLMCAFARQRVETFFESKPKVQGPWCNPRSACAADRYMQVLAAQNNGVIPINDGGFQAGLEGKIGAPATASLMEFCEFQINLPKYEDVVADPSGTMIPKSADQIMLMAYGLAGRTQKEHLGPCIEYMSRKEMPKDMQITYVQALLRRDPHLAYEDAMQAWVAKNASLVTIVGSLVKA